MEADLDGTLKWKVEGQLLFKETEASAKLAIRIEDTGHVSKLCVKTLFIFETIIPNFVAFFVSLGIVILCVRKMSFSVTSAKQEFTPAIVSLFTSQEVDNVY